MRYDSMRWIWAGRRINGHLVERAPRGVDTPAGFYHNEPRVSPPHERYLGNRGVFPDDADKLDSGATPA